MTRFRLIAACLTIAIAAAGAAVFAQDIFRNRSRVSGSTYGNVEYDGRVTFVRIRYEVGYSGMGRRGSRGELPWAHDYPTADLHMMKILNELTSIEARADGSNVLTLDDPELFNYPIAYMSEPGFWTASDDEIAGLRSYLLKGGFIIFDDFVGNHWYNLEQQMRRVLPDGRWIELDKKHPVFTSFFEITNFSFSSYGIQEIYYGMFENNDPNGRLLAIAGLNQDLGEFWEFSDTGLFPVDLSNEAYKYGVNYFIYGLTH